MKVQAITPRGYCSGVINAITIVKKSAKSPKPIYILGRIVHNQYIVDALTSMGIITVDEPGSTRLALLDKIDHGTVIITAHGASDAVFEKAKKKGLTIVDATCPDVIVSHNTIRNYLRQGYHILYIGKQGHPEAEGAISICPSKIHMICNKKDIDRLADNHKYVITNQTTMSLYNVYDICEYAKEKLSNLKISKETCQATRVRQEAIATIDPLVDIVFIIGDTHSNNTQKLADIAKTSTNGKVIAITCIDDIDISLLKNCHYVAVSSGASTPTYLTNQVIAYLRQFDPIDPKTHIKPTIEMSKIL